MPNWNPEMHCFFTAISCIVQKRIYHNMPAGQSSPVIPYSPTWLIMKPPLPGKHLYMPVPDEAILEWKTDSFSGADFLKKENDPALKETSWEAGVNKGL